MAINVKDKLVTVESLGIAYSIEQGARQEADQALSTRIDNIVAPDGDPSLTEVSDARVSGSTTHNTLKARLDADQAAVGTEIAELKADLQELIDGGTGSSLTDTQKALFVEILRAAVYSSDQSKNIDALEESFANTVVSITATLDLHGNTIYSDDSLDTLRQYLTVRAAYDDGTSQTITGYALSGTLTVGTSTITVSYRDCYATVTVPVSQAITRYTVTNNLTGVANSNTDISIAEGNTYTGILTAETAGYIPTDVSVMVGGTDVTSTVYDSSTHTITITDVRGNIVIVAHEDEDPYAPVFELTSPLILGDTTDSRINDTENNRIATGVTIKDDETWTMCIDLNSKTDGDNRSIVTVVTNNAQTKLTYARPYWNLQWHNDTAGPTSDSNNYKFIGVHLIYVLTHEKDSTIANCYGTKEKAITNSHALTNNGQIYIGSLIDAGTLNRFSIYKRILSSDEITAWIGE